MLAPAWKLPALIVLLSLLAIVVLPGTQPAVLFGGVVIAWLVAGLLFLALRRRNTRVA